MSLRQSDTDHLANKASDSNAKAAENAADKLVSHLPGQSKPRDALSSDAQNPVHNATPNAAAFKPSGEQSLGEKVEVEADKLKSHVQPNEQQSIATTLKNAITPGNDSSLTPHNHVTGSNDQGVIAAVGQKVVEAKDAVVNAVTGTGTGNASGNTTGGAAPAA